MRRRACVRRRQALQPALRASRRRRGAPPNRAKCHRHREKERPKRRLTPRHHPPSRPLCPARSIDPPTTPDAPSPDLSRFWGENVVTAWRRVRPPSFPRNHGAKNAQRSSWFPVRARNRLETAGKLGHIDDAQPPLIFVDTRATGVAEPLLLL